MAELKVEALKRIFVDKKTDMTLDDPNPSYPPDKVMSFYSNQYPHLANGSVEGPDIGKDTLTYKFVTTVGTKG